MFDFCTVVHLISDQLSLAYCSTIKYTKQVDILKYTGRGDVDKVQVPAVGCYGNLVDVSHTDGISGPASKSPCVGHFLCWISS